MVNFICDDQQVQARLEKLVDLVVKNNGALNPALDIICRDGQFSLSGAAAVGQEKPCIFIPESCFIPLTQMKFSIKDGQIHIEDMPKHFSEDQVQLAELIFELYRLSDKYKYYLSAAPIELYYHDRALFEFLTRGYEYDVLNMSEKTETHIHGFIKTRSFPDNRDKESGQQNKIILPVIEYANHNRHGFPNCYLKNWKGSGQAVQFVIANPLEGTDEIFINYSTEDTRELLFWQTYNERDIDHVKSIPLAFSLGRALDVKIFTGDRKLAEDLFYDGIKDLSFYFPMVTTTKEKAMIFDFIYIPSAGAPYALRRILAASLGEFIEADKLEDAVLQAEHFIVRENIEYYQQGLEKLAAYAPPAALENVMALMKEMHHMQLERLKSYMFYDEAMSYASKNF